MEKRPDKYESILNLVYLCRSYDLDEVADYWEGIIRINDYQKERFVLNILSAMFNTLAGKKICLFGFAFKANTDDTRESPCIFIAKRLIEERAELIITDPKTLNNAMIDLEGIEGKITYAENPYESSAGCGAIAFMTEWEIYASLNYEDIPVNVQTRLYL